MEHWKKKIKKRIKGTTADNPNKTINIDLCFIPAERECELDFSAFFQQMDELSVGNSEGNAVTVTDKSGLDIFSHENKNYDEKMDAYVVMRKNKEEKLEERKTSDIRDIKEMEMKADTKQEEEELMAWRRKIRIERRKEDEEWNKYRDERIEQKKRWEELTKEEKNGFRADKKISDKEWCSKKSRRGELRAKRYKEDEGWRNKRKEIKEQRNITVTSLLALLVIIDNCTRKCLGLPLFLKGKRVTADDVIMALEDRLPPELKYIISDNGKQFIAEAFQRLCKNKGIVHVRITKHRPATNGIAERFVERLKGLLAEREWLDVEELVMILEEVIAEYNDAPHQGLHGLSPNEYERRLIRVASG